MKITSILVIKKLDDQDSPAVANVLAHLRLWAAKYDIMITTPGNQRIEEVEIPAEEQYVVVGIGGDGTVITASKWGVALNCPVIGFNLGKVGFLADFPANSVYETMEAYVNDSMVIDSRTTIATSHRGVDLGIALNDVAVSCALSDTSLSYTLHVGGVFAGSHTANGVIFCTPTGSTAYALAVGGAIMMPEISNIMQITPIAPHTMTSRPLIVPNYQETLMTFSASKKKPVTVRLDGVIVLTLGEDDDVPKQHTISVVDGVKSRVRLAHHASWNHFDILNKKLGWNK